MAANWAFRLGVAIKISSDGPITIHARTQS